MKQNRATASILLYEKTTFTLCHIDRGRYGLSGRGAFPPRVTLAAIAAIAGRRDWPACAGVAAARGLLGSRASLCARPPRLLRVRVRRLRLPSVSPALRISAVSLSVSRWLLRSWSLAVIESTDSHQPQAETRVSAFFISGNTRQYFLKPSAVRAQAWP